MMRSEGRMKMKKMIARLIHSQERLAIREVLSDIFISSPYEILLKYFSDYRESTKKSQFV